MTCKDCFLFEKCLETIKRSKAEVETFPDGWFSIGGCNHFIDKNPYVELTKEIDDLKTEVAILSQKRVNIFERLEAFERGRLKGIKEFAERLKKRLYEKPTIFTQQRYIVNSEIDNLVEEMKGGADK